MSENVASITYPDSLVNMWKLANNIPVEKFSELHYKNCWKTIDSAIKNYAITNLKLGNKEDSLKVFTENVYDYLIDLMQGPCPEYVVSEKIFWKNYTKFKIQHSDPEGYEVNMILHRALRQLEKNQLIQRDFDHVDQIINSETRFALSSIKNPSPATKFDYEINQAQVPHFSTSKRGNTYENSKIISPKNAQQLVLALLTAFGGWTTKSDLLSAFKNHIPPLFKTYSLSAPIGNDDSDKTVQHDAPDADSASYIYEYDYRQIIMLVQEISSRIWTRVTQISDKVFCLYSLPKLQDKKVVMKDVGSTSTVGDQNLKIVKVLQEELTILKEKQSSVLRHNQAVNEAVKRITEKLQQSCTEFGWI